MRNFDIGSFLNRQPETDRTRWGANNDRRANTFEAPMDNGPSVRVGDLEILSIQFSETGTYNPEYLRPWSISTDTDTVDQITGIVHETPGMVNAKSIAGITGNMLRYSSEVSQRDLVEIEGSWDSVRLAVIIELIEHGRGLHGDTSEEVTYITGFTNYMDTSDRGISPDTVIYVSNVFRVHNQSRSVISSNQLIVPTYHQGNSYQAPTLHTIRPKDCFISEMIHEKTPPNARNVNMYGSLTGTTLRSSKTNNLSAASYISSSLNALRASVEGTDQSDPFGNPGWGGRNRSLADIYNGANGLLREDDSDANSFLFMLRSNSNTFTSDSTFTWEDILEIFGRDVERTTILNKRKTVRENTRSKSRYSQAGDCADWDNTEDNGYNAIIATAFKQALPAYAIQSLIYACRVEINNYGSDPDGYNNYDGFNITVSNVIFVAPLTQNDQDRLIDRLKVNIAAYIARDVSLNNTLVFDAIIELDWRFDSFLSVGVEGGPLIEYSTAAFAASLTSPIITLDENFSSAMVSDMNTIVDRIVRG